MDTEYSEAIKEWSWLIDIDFYQPVGISPFGDVVLRDKSGALSLLDINMGELLPASSSVGEHAILFPEHYAQYVVTGYERAGLKLREGQCYGYKQQVVAGGKWDETNVYVATAHEYIGFMGDFHRQIQDVPNGGKVLLTVKNRRVVQ